MKSELNLNEVLVITDDENRIGRMVSYTLASTNMRLIHIPSKTPLKKNWARFRSCRRVIIDWQCHFRTGGAIVEEILEIDPKFPVNERVVVLITDPLKEDVVYFSELGLRRIVQIQESSGNTSRTCAELRQHILDPLVTSPAEKTWLILKRQLEQLIKGKRNDDQKLEAIVRKMFKHPERSARFQDALAMIWEARGDGEKARSFWKKSLEINPNYHPAYEKLASSLIRAGKLEEGFQKLRQMQMLNRNRVSRLVTMGEVQFKMKHVERAEKYFRSALQKNAYASGALNGMAEISFSRGDLDECKEFLARSNLSMEVASRLNKAGIELVRQQRYEAALHHYINARYVLPTNEKGPLLFYNIALCYSKWGKVELAQEYLRLALIKNPSYDKATTLLANLQNDSTMTGAPAQIEMHQPA